MSRRDREAGERYPHRAVRGRAARTVSHRRGAARDHAATDAPEGGDRLAHQGDGVRSNIAERRLPRNGVIKLKTADGKEINFRTSVLPTVFGEKVVLRLLAKGSLELDLGKLGMDPDAYHHFKKAIAEPSGMLLVTGRPAAARPRPSIRRWPRSNKVERNISSAEDPVEIYLRGINQVNVNEPIGLTFGAVLRSFLRQDPDVLMVGEIRDFETIGDRRQGGAHRAPGALDPSHQRRSGDHRTHAQHGRRSLPGRVLAELDRWRNVWPASSAATADRDRRLPDRSSARGRVSARRSWRA